MVLKVVFKNGTTKEFAIDDFYVADNDICLYMKRNGRDVGMINLCEVSYYYVDERVSYYTDRILL